MQLRPLLSIAIELEPAALLGPFPAGERRVVPFRSGTFAGPDGLQGTVAPGGVDWQTVRPDGTIEIRAHYLLVTDEGEPIEVTSEGLRVAGPDVAARLQAGEPVDPAEYYFRTAVRLATSSSRWRRLNDILCVGRGERGPLDVTIHVHEVM